MFRYICTIEGSQQLTVIPLSHKAKADEAVNSNEKQEEMINKQLSMSKIVNKMDEKCPFYCFFIDILDLKNIK